MVVGEAVRRRPAGVTRGRARRAPRAFSARRAAPGRGPSLVVPPLGRTRIACRSGPAPASRREPAGRAASRLRTCAPEFADGDRHREEYFDHDDIPRSTSNAVDRGTGAAACAGSAAATARSQRGDCPPAVDGRLLSLLSSWLARGLANCGRATARTAAWPLCADRIPQCVAGAERRPVGRAGAGSEPTYARHLTVARVRFDRYFGCGQAPPPGCPACLELPGHGLSFGPGGSAKLGATRPKVTNATASAMAAFLVRFIHFSLRRT